MTLLLISRMTIFLWCWNLFWLAALGYMFYKMVPYLWERVFKRRLMPKKALRDGIAELQNLLNMLREAKNIRTKYRAESESSLSSFRYSTEGAEVRNKLEELEELAFGGFMEAVEARFNHVQAVASEPDLKVVGGTGSPKE